MAERALSPLSNSHDGANLPPPWWAEFMELQRQMRDALLAHLAAQEQRQSGKRSARPIDVVFVKGIGEVTRGIAFLTCEIIERAKRDRRLRAFLREHHAATAEALGTKLGVNSKRAPAGGFSVERICKVAGGVLWRIESDAE